MTDERLKAIRDRCEAATPGPWAADKGRPLHYGPIGDGEDPRVYCFKNLPFKNADADWTFIAHARADVPLLLALVARYAGAIAEIEALCDEKLSKHASACDTAFQCGGAAAFKAVAGILAKLREMEA